MYAVNDFAANTPNNMHGAPSGRTNDGRRDARGPDRDPYAYPKGIWNKVHYASTHSGNAPCFNCCESHIYPSCTASFTGAETFTANAKSAIASGIYSGRIEALPRTRGYFDDCRTTYQLYFKGKDTAQTTSRSEPPAADIAALAIRLRADLDARRK